MLPVQLRVRIVISAKNIGTSLEEPPETRRPWRDYSAIRAEGKPAEKLFAAQTLSHFARNAAMILTNCIVADGVTIWQFTPPNGINKAKKDIAR